MRDYRVSMGRCDGGAYIIDFALWESELSYFFRDCGR